MSSFSKVSKITVPLVLNSKNKEIVSMVTAYDYPTARLVEKSQIEIVLVGDSLGNVVLGYDNTLPVTMEESLHHCRAVAKGNKYSLLVGDMPFMSYQQSDEKAVENAGRFIKEAGMHAVKLEGGARVVDRVKAIVNSDIPVMGHIGLTPQSIHKLGGHKVQGKTTEAAEQLVNDAIKLERAGCFSIVLECIPSEVAKKITETINIPTIGIGSGEHCDGQVLVFHDLVGFTVSDFKPKFVKKYADVSKVMLDALDKYKKEVKEKKYPNKEYSY